MTRKMKWGLAILVILLGAATVLIVQHEREEIRELEIQLAESNKLLEQNDKVKHAVSKADEKPPDEQGFDWIRHGDHWDRIPIAQESDEQLSASNAGIWYPPEELAMSDEERRKLYLEREAKWKAHFAAIAAENAKIHARKVADYELLKKKHAIIVKIAFLNHQMNEIGNISEDGEIRNFESSDQLLELIQQKRLLFAEYDNLKEEPGNDD